MRIAYFTTAQDAEEYEEFSLKRKLDPNSSNQVFHSNFIECLSLSNEVEVFSSRSDKTQTNDSLTKREGKVVWNYLKTKQSKISNFLSQSSEIKKHNNDCSVAFVDTMNIRCLLLAKKYCSRNKIPLMGLVTDNPRNISGMSKMTTTLLSFFAKKCNAFVCLTESLNNIYNKANKPSLLIKGLSKNSSHLTKSPVNYPYFFYAGTLLSKYGICELIQAYKSLKDVGAKLVIAGHHEDEEFRNAIKDSPRIVYLGNIDNDIVIKYENYSIANINPRPFMENIDSDSIPSKVIEYSSKNSLIISGVSTPLKSDFKNAILWINEKHSLADRMQQAYEMDELTRNLLIKDVNYTCQKNFSFEANNKKLKDFISKIVG